MLSPTQIIPSSCSAVLLITPPTQPPSLLPSPCKPSSCCQISLYAAPDGRASLTHTHTSTLIYRWSPCGALLFVSCRLHALESASPEPKHRLLHHLNNHHPPLLQLRSRRHLRPAKQARKYLRLLHPAHRCCHHHQPHLHR